MGTCSSDAKPNKRQENRPKYEILRPSKKTDGNQKSKIIQVSSSSLKQKNTNQMQEIIWECFDSFDQNGNGFL